MANKTIPTILTNEGNVGIGISRSASLNTTAAANGTGGGNRGFDTSFSSTTTGFTGTDSTDQGFGYFAATIVSGRSYEVSATMVVTNGAPLSFITSSGLNFATQTVQSIASPPVSNTTYRFVATADAAFFGIGINRTSGTMTAVVSNFSIKEVGSTLVTSDTNVGIGVASPTSLLHISGAAPTIKLQGSSSASAKVDLAGTYTTWSLENQYVNGATNDMFRIYNSALSADAITINRSTNNVGIGTTNPSSKLHIDDATTPWITISRAGVPTWQLRNNFPSNQYGFSFNNTTAGTVPLFIGAGGNIGIGLDSPAAKLDIVGTTTTIALSFGTTVPNNPLFINTYAGSMGIGMDQTTAGIRLAGDYASAAYPLVDIGYYSGGTVSHANWVNRLRVQQNGNVGIGTTVPTYRLDIEGASTTSVVQNVRNPSTAWTQYALTRYQTDVKDSRYVDVGYFRGAGAEATRGFVISGLNSNILTLLDIVGGYNLGLGGVTAPLFNIDVASTQGKGIQLRYDTGTGYRAQITPYWNTSTDTRIDFAINRSANLVADVIMSVGYGSKVGIGTTAPTGTLTIQSNSNQLRLQTATGPGAYFTNISSFYDSTHPFAIEVANNSSSTTEYFGIYSDAGGANSRPVFPNGNVGIGTTRPSGKLTVQGNIEVNYNSTTADTSVRRSFLTTHATINRGANITFGLFDGGSNPMGMTVYNVAAAAGAYNSQFIAFYTHEGGVNEGERMRITQSGNVGIGTFTPLSLLTVGEAGSTSAAKGLSFGGDASANLYRSAASTIKTDGSLEVTTSLNIGADLYVADELGVGVLIANKRVNYGAQISAASASIQLVLGRTTSSTGQGAIGADSANTFAVWNVSGGFTKQLVVTQQGNVSIGTDTPNYKLEVNGIIGLYGASNNHRKLAQASSWGYSSSYRTIILGSTSSTYNVADGAVTLCFGVDVSANANGSFQGDGRELVFRNLTRFVTPNAANTSYLNPLTFNNGNVGIGSDIPGAKLDVNGDVYVSPNTAGKNTFILSTNASNDARLLMRSDVTTKVDIQANGTSYFNGGNVGIGETSPIQKLHVLGNTVFGNFGNNTYKYNLYLSFEAAADESWIRIYLPQNYFSANNGGTVKVRVLWAGDHATFGAHEEYQISYKTFYPSPYLTFSKIICTNKTTDFAVGGSYYGASSTPDVIFYSNADDYLYIKIKGFSATYNRSRFVEAEVFGRTAATPTITTTTAPASSTELVKTIQFLPQGGNIYTAGSIGVGTTNTDPLSLSRDINLAIVTTATNAALTIVGGAAGRIDFGVGATRTAGIYSDSSNYTEIFTSTALPLVFSTNNAAKMRITAAGLVGIGTATPNTLLSVGGAGSTLPASGITFGGNSVANLYRSEADHIKTDGSFVVTNTLIVGGGQNGIRILKNGSDSISSNLYIANAANTRVFNFQQNAAGTNLALWTYNSANAWQNTVNFNYNGSVGIGTTTPSGKLHIVSTIAGETVLRTDGTNGTLFSVVDDLSDSLMSVNNSAGLPVLEVFADDRVVAGQYGSGDFVLINNKVGLGTSNPTNKLSVIGGANIGSSTYNVAAPSDGLIVEGRVGIGSTSPNYKLDVYSPALDAGRFYNNLAACQLNIGSTNNTEYTNLIWYTSNGNTQFFKNRANASWGGTDSMNLYNSNGGFAFHPNGVANSVIITTAGDVGINKTTPTTKLDVVGSFRVVGTTNVGGIFVTGSSASQGNIRPAVNNGSVLISDDSGSSTRGLTVSNGGGAIISSADANYDILTLQIGGTTNHTFDRNGNVGIGLTAPNAARLHIKGNNSDPVLRVESASLVAGTSTASKTFVAWLPIMTGSAAGDKVFIPLFKN